MTETELCVPSKELPHELSLLLRSWHRKGALVSQIQLVQQYQACKGSWNVGVMESGERGKERARVRVRKHREHREKTDPGIMVAERPREWSELESC